MKADQIWTDRVRLYYVIGALETDLRRIIAQWILPFQEEETLYGILLPSLERRRAAEGQSRHATDLLEYLDFADAYRLINRFRDMVPAEVGAAVRASHRSLNRSFNLVTA